MQGPLLGLEDWDVSEVRRGVGDSHAHHGEVLQGMFADDQGRPTPALVTLPCRLFWSRAHVALMPGEGVTVLHPYPQERFDKARRAAEATLTHLGLSGWGAVIRLASAVPRARGLGSSTADVLATIRALVDAAGTRLAPADMAMLAVESEQACDSLMYGQPVLFAHRDGRTLEVLPGPLPPMTVLGFDAFPEHPGVDTVASGTVPYDSVEYATFQRLRTDLRDALSAGDLGGVGAVATESARMNQRYRPLPLLPRVLQEYTRWRARGVQVAHSGTVVGVLFDPSPAGRAAVDAARLALREMGVTDSWVFDGG